VKKRTDALDRINTDEEDPMPENAVEKTDSLKGGKKGGGERHRVVAMQDHSQTDLLRAPSSGIRLGPRSRNLRREKGKAKEKGSNWGKKRVVGPTRKRKKPPSRKMSLGLCRVAHTKKKGI